MKKSKKSSSKAGGRETKEDEARIEKAFDEALLKRASQIAGGYRVIIEPSRAGGFIGWSSEMPGVLADGRSSEECVKATYRALQLSVATLLEMGERPPSPHWKRERTAQLNIRLTQEEKLILEEAGRERGFKGVSDFVRSSALQRASSPV